MNNYNSKIGLSNASMNTLGFCITCSKNCKNSCSGDCEGQCAGKCEDTCRGTCNDSCYGSSAYDGPIL